MIDLGDLKDIGDRSAHSRYYTANRMDIDDHKVKFRVVAERLLYLSGHKT